MHSINCLLLLLIVSRFDSARSGGCTARTSWQKDTVVEFQNRLTKDLKFDCDCAERAEGIAWVETIKGRTDPYERRYHIFTTKLTGRPLANQYDQLRCMLDKLKNEHASQIKKEVPSGVRFGCAYTRTPEAPKLMDNVSQALTCVYAKDGYCA